MSVKPVPVAALIFILACVLPVGTLALGIAPASRRVDFIPGIIERYGFMVVGDPTSDMEVQPFFRGDLEPYMNMSVDRFVVPAGGKFNFAHLTTNNIERIEIIRGLTFLKILNIICMKNLLGFLLLEARKMFEE